MPAGQRIRKGFLLFLMVGTVLSVVAYGTAVAANLAGTPVGDPENPNPSPSPLPQFTLTVHVSGTGAGLVVLHPTGKKCGSGCQAHFSSNVSVTLTAQPAGSSVFGGWTGACHGHTTCKVPMTSAKSVTAAFKKGAHLSVGRVGHGSVTSSGVHCPGDCGQNYALGATVKLSQHATPGSHFLAWKGACTGHGGCRVHMRGARSVRAVFVPNHH